MKNFKGINFVNDKGTSRYSRVMRCSRAMKQTSHDYMASVVKFVDADPVLPILPEYAIKKV